MKYWLQVNRCFSFSSHTFSFFFFLSFHFRVPLGSLVSDDHNDHKWKNKALQWINQCRYNATINWKDNSHPNQLSLQFYSYPEWDREQRDSVEAKTFLRLYCHCKGLLVIIILLVIKTVLLKNADCLSFVAWSFVAQLSGKINEEKRLFLPLVWKIFNYLFDDGNQPYGCNNSLVTYVSVEQVCACTRVGCAQGTSCAVTKGTTNKESMRNHSFTRQSQTNKLLENDRKAMLCLLSMS